jgi:hypothetical protein
VAAIVVASSTAARGLLGWWRWFGGRRDEILITGTAFSPPADFVALRCLVATVGDDGTLKVWPIQPPEAPSLSR